MQVKKYMQTLLCCCFPLFPPRIFNLRTGFCVNTNLHFYCLHTHACWPWRLGPELVSPGGPSLRWDWIQLWSVAPRTLLSLRPGLLVHVQDPWSHLSADPGALSLMSTPRCRRMSVQTVLPTPLEPRHLTSGPSWKQKSSDHLSLSKRLHRTGR